jgi:hypothetical protein
MSKQVLKRVSPHTSIWVDEEDETMNNKKQSSIEWLLSSNKQLYYDLHEGRIHQHEYHPKLKEIEQQAKQMHKEEIEHAYRCGAAEIGMIAVNKPKQYYNETFGGDNE